MTDEQVKTLKTYVDREVLDGLIRSQTWDAVLNEHNTNNSCNKFVQILESIRYEATTYKKVSSWHKKLKPWITLSLIKKIKQRYKHVHF